MKILAIGDVTDERAVSYLTSRLWDERRRLGADLVLVNGENAGFIRGASVEQAKSLLSAGADVITGGNHTLSGAGILHAAENLPGVLRPLNLPDAPGFGYTIAEPLGYRVLVISALGRALMNNTVDCPFRAIDRLLAAEEGRYDAAIVDFHAESSGEKLALAHYLDGRVAAVIGTHTHVPTADEQILPGGTAYLTDVGMCGPAGSILGSLPDSVIYRYLSGVYAPLVPGTGEICADGVLIEVDPSRGCATAIQRVRI